MSVLVVGFANRHHILRLQPRQFPQSIADWYTSPLGSSDETARRQLVRSSNLRLILPLFIVISVAAQQAPQQSPAKPLFKLQEAMVPVRDGVHLQTTILIPVDQRGPLPILFRRTPYGVPDKAPEEMPNFFKKQTAQKEKQCFSLIFTH